MRLITDENLTNSLFAQIQSNALKNGNCHWDGYKNWCIRGEEIEQAIKDLFAEGDIFKPTIDIVQCKDCKHRAIGDDVCIHPNRIGDGYIEVTDDDFCSYGERRDDNL